MHFGSVIAADTATRQADPRGSRSETAPESFRTPPKTPRTPPPTSSVPAMSVRQIGQGLQLAGASVPASPPPGRDGPPGRALSSEKASNTPKPKPPDTTPKTRTT